MRDWLGGAVVAVAALAAAVLGTIVSPIAAAAAFAVILVALGAAFVYALRMRTLFEGPYAVIDNEVFWTLKGPKGRDGSIRNLRYVRFNYRCAVIVERVGGMPDDTIKALRSEYGSVVKTGKRPGGDEYAIIELAADKQRNDKTHLISTLGLSNAFSSPEDCWIGHVTVGRTKKAKLDVVFPEGEPPKDLRLWRKSSDSTEDIPLSGGPGDGRRTASWEENGCVCFRLRERPKRLEEYRLEWKW
jgi:hypothetical protein